MKRVSTIFLRAAILVIGAVIAAICLLLLPLLWTYIDSEYSGYTFAVYVVFIALWVAALPFFVGLYKGWRLLDFIDSNKAFSESSVKALGSIALCAALISAVFIVGVPFFYIWAENDDAPGLIIISMVLVGAPLVVSVFAAVLQRLISEAVELKSENELTV